MGDTKLYLFVQMMILNMTLSSHGQAPSSQCKVKSVLEGEPTEVLCMFSEDVFITKKEFVVQRYKLNVTLDKINPREIEAVLDCTLVDKGNYTCQTAQGYELPGGKVEDAGSNVSLLIPAAGREHVGRYVCLIRQASPDKFQDCLFVLKGGPRVATDRSTPSLKDVNCKESIADANTYNASDNPIIIGLAVGLGLTFVALCVVSMLAVRWCRRLKMLEENTETKPEKKQHKDAIPLLNYQLNVDPLRRRRRLASC